MLNNQPAEPYHDGDGLTLDVIEVFHTLQGEGPFAGHASIFIRLAGCNLQCPTCDTVYTGPLRRKAGAPSLVREAIKLQTQHVKTNLVVITGGEPLRQNIQALVSMLLQYTDFNVQLETNGIHDLPSIFRKIEYRRRLTVVVSPKTNKINTATARAADAYKYVLSYDDLQPDGLPTRALGHKAAPHVARPPQGWKGLIYVNPCDDKDPERNALNLTAARDSALKFGYVLGVQMHKIVNLP